MRMLRVAFALQVCIARIAWAQGVKEIHLAPADGTLPTRFLNVLSIHELSDGRVLLGDAMQQTLGVADIAKRSFARTANVNADPFVALPADTTLLFGIGTTSWVFMVGNQPVGILPVTNPVVQGSYFLYGADSLGHVLTTAPPVGTSDSERVMLVDRISAEHREIARLWIYHRPAVFRDFPVYPVYDNALLTMDGWVAVTRVHPNRVDWRAPDGRWILGAPLPIAPVPMNDRERRAFLARQQLVRAGRDSVSIGQWPDVVEPWSTDRPIASPDAKILVRRNPTADFPESRYDVINRRGELEKILVLKPNEKVIGFGRASIYVAVTAADLTQTVERHEWNGLGT